MQPLLTLFGLLQIALIIFLLTPLILVISKHFSTRRNIDFLGDGATTPSTKPPPAPQSPYLLARSILTDTERQFLITLSSLALPGTYIAPKVRLADIFTTKHGRGFYRAFNQISAKHVDFLLIDDLSAAPLAGIELDDHTHARTDRRARDRFVDDTFAACGLSLIHVPVSSQYDNDALRSAIAKALRAD